MKFHFLFYLKISLMNYYWSNIFILQADNLQCEQSQCVFDIEDLYDLHFQ